jgi:hypothetical protein
MQFFMFVPNIASQMRKQMKKIVKYVKYSNQSENTPKMGRYLHAMADRT